MSLEQVRFLGASVTGFTANIGWGSQESRLQCTLVEDYRYGDSFEPPEVGLPVVFNYMGWEFAGLLEGYHRSNNFNINPGYDVSVVDPRVLLDGVHIILADFQGQTNGVPNLINVFGYLENTNGFGGSKSNESGIEWWKIVNTITTLTVAQQSTAYGGPISYKSIRYNVNLSGLPQIPNNYRVSASPNMSLMDFINEVCEVGASEYFVTLVGSTITINTISRANVPLGGIINQYVSNTDGATSKNVGVEMVNDICSKFLIGGKKSDIFFANYTRGGEDEEVYTTEDNPIEQYWGKDADGNLILATENNSAFNLDARGVLIPNVPNTYKTDVGEMRAALVSQDSWESYLWLHCFNEFVFSIVDDAETDMLYKIENDKFVKPFASGSTYKHENVPNPHFRKAFDIGVGCRYNYNLAQYLNGANPQDIITANMGTYRQYTMPGYNKEQESNMTKLYGMVRSYADEYYGRKYMVMLPEVYVARDEDTGELSYSHNIVEAGYLEESVVEDAVDNNMMPVNSDDVSTPDGRISAYVRFDNIETLDLSELQPLDLLFGKDLIKSAGGNKYTGTVSVFIRCTIDEKFVFLDKDNFTSPRAIVTLTSRIGMKEPLYGSSVLAEYLNTQKLMNDWSDADFTAVKEAFLNSVMADVFGMYTFPFALTPKLVAVPIESNVDTYGPWYAAGANGRIEVERSEDLVPWNYDGFENMELAANARVSAAIGNLQWIESGSIEFPGVPAVSLGSQLLSQGPYITDISIKIGVDGVTTNYMMRAWNPKFGKMSKYNVDRLQKMSKVAQQIKRNFRENIKLNSFKSRYLDVSKLGGFLP